MRTVVLTGAAGGIGRALTSAMVARGDRVVMVDIDPDVQDVAARLAAVGPGTAHAVVADLRDPAAVQGVVDQVVADNGALDVLVNNAGVLVTGYTDELTLEHWRRAVEVNLNGVIHGVHAAYRVMATQGHGHIVNMASLGGLMPVTLGVPFATTAHAVVGLSLSLRGEAAARGVQVSVVCPAVVDTPMIDTGNPPTCPPCPPGYRPGRPSSAGTAPSRQPRWPRTSSPAWTATRPSSSLLAAPEPPGRPRNEHPTYSPASSPRTPCTGLAGRRPRNPEPALVGGARHDQGRRLMRNRWGSSHSPPSPSGLTSQPRHEA